MILGISILEYLTSYFILGLHFGWIDDVFVMLQLKGEVISPQNGFFNLRGNNYYSYLYIWLYNNIDGINWYGVFLSLYTGFCILNINFILFHLVSKIGFRVKRLFILLSLAFFVAFVIENVYLLNFTRIAILLTYTSVISIVVAFKNYYQTKYGKWLIALFCFFFFTGWNCRLPAVILFLPTMILFLFFSFKGMKKYRAIGVLVVFTGLYIGCSMLIINKKDRAELKSINHTEKYLHNILNGFNGKQAHDFDNPQDSIKALALYRWYFADRDSVFNDAFLEELGSNNPFKMSVLSKWRKNIKDELIKSKHYYKANYLVSLNWYNKSICFLLIIGFLPLLLLFYFSVSSRSFIKSALFSVAIFIFIILIMIFFKMEDRALGPLLIFTFLGSWTLANDSKKDLHEHVIYVLILVFAVVGIYRAQGYRDIKDQRNYDLDLKEKIRSNLNKFYSDKTIFFDLYSFTVLETHPIWDVNFPDNWTSGIEMFNMHNEEHLSNIEAKIGCLDWPCFFQEVGKTPTDFLFFYSKERVIITKEYHRLIYDYDLEFTEHSKTMLVNNFHYSFFWMPFDIGYFSVKPKYENIDSP